MGNNLRCCISCILPCGALDVIRIVHSNGHVEEIAGYISAGDVMKANPKHVLKKHCTEGVRVIILPPEAQLKRGHIYFLSAVASSNSSFPAEKNAIHRSKSQKKGFNQQTHSDRKMARVMDNSKASPADDQYLTEILSERKCSLNNRTKRRGRVGIWRPHLESIMEDL